MYAKIEEANTWREAAGEARRVQISIPEASDEISQTIKAISF